MAPKTEHGYLHAGEDENEILSDTSTPSKLDFPTGTTTVTYSGGWESYKPKHIKLSRAQRRQVVRIMEDRKMTNGQKQFAIGKIKKKNEIKD